MDVESKYPALHAAGVGLGLFCAVGGGLIGDRVVRSPYFPRLLTALFVVAMSFTPLVLLATIASGAPDKWMNSIEGIGVLVLILLVTAVLNSLVSADDTWPWVKPRWREMLAATIVVMVFGVPALLKQPAWFPTQIATKVGIRTTSDVWLALPAKTVEEVRTTLPRCAAKLVHAPSADSPSHTMLAKVLLLVGASGRLKVLVPGECVAPANPGSTRVAFDVTGTGIRQVPRATAAPQRDM